MPTELKPEYNWTPIDLGPVWSQMTDDNGLKPENNANKREIFAQNSAPTLGFKEGDLWFDTDDNNTIYRANTALSWVSVKDGTIANKVSIFKQAAVPTATAVGDLWFDSDDDNKPYRAAAVGADQIAAGEWVLITPSALATYATDLGAIIAGTIVLPTTGFIRGGQTDYDTGIGFFHGYSGAAYKSSIGDSSGEKMLWTGSALEATDIKTLFSVTAGDTITAGDAVCVGNGTDIHEDTSYSVGSSEAHDTYLGQTFTTSSLAKTINRIDLVLNVSSASKTLTCNLYATSGGLPTGSSLASGTINTAETGNPVTRSWTLGTPLSVSASTMYALTVSGFVLNETDWLYNATGAYSGGTGLQSADGVSWSTNARDYRFGVVCVQTTAGRLYKTDASSNDEYANNFIGFAYENGTSGNACRVVSSAIYTGLSGLTVGSQYYLSDTAGAIATSAGSVSRKIGIAVATTKLLIKHDNQ